MEITEFGALNLSVYAYMFVDLKYKSQGNIVSQYCLPLYCYQKDLLRKRCQYQNFPVQKEHNVDHHSTNEHRR
jgi:hypothetical protein